MNKIKNSLLLIACFYSFSTYAAIEHIHLDSSKDVFFEQFAPNTFSLQLLESKNSFSPSDIVFGSLIEADLQAWRGELIQIDTGGTYKQGGGLYFTQASIDGMWNMNHWLTLFLSVADAHIGWPRPDGNYIYVPHGFVTFGNLSDHPVFVTAGINTIPFGVFTGSGSWDTPLTSSYFNPIQANQLSVGYFKNGWNLSATTYRDNVNHQTNFVYSFYFNKTVNDKLSYSFGAGYLSDLKSNSAGNPTSAQANSLSPSIDLGAVMDFNASLDYSLVGLTAEFLRSSNSVTEDHTKPAALALAVTYSPTIAGKDTTFGLSFSRAFNLQNVATPLTGRDAIPLAASGLRTALAASVTRAVYSDKVYLGFDVERTSTFTAEQSYTATIDMTAYL